MLILRWFSLCLLAILMILSASETSSNQLYDEERHKTTQGKMNTVHRLLEAVMDQYPDFPILEIMEKKLGNLQKELDAIKE